MDVAELCTEFGRSRNGEWRSAAPPGGGPDPDAVGLIVWAWDPIANELRAWRSRMDIPIASSLSFRGWSAITNSATAAAFRAERTRGEAIRN